MKISQYFSRKIKALTADKQEISEAPLFEELDDSQASTVCGGLAVEFGSDNNKVGFGSDNSQGEFDIQIPGGGVGIFGDFNK